jgi:hypothetical protein
MISAHDRSRRLPETHRSQAHSRSANLIDSSIYFRIQHMKTGASPKGELRGVAGCELVQEVVAEGRPGG